MFIRTGDAHLYATAYGPRTAPPLLAVSGWIGTWEDWADTFSLLSEHWRVIGYDHRGSGASVVPVESISHARLVDDVFAVLDAYGVERCVLAAMSAGAVVAFSAVLRRPERFTGLVIANAIDLRAPVPADGPFHQMLDSDYDGALRFFVEACVPEPNSELIRRWGRQILDRAEPAAPGRFCE